MRTKLSTGDHAQSTKSKSASPDGVELSFSVDLRFYVICHTRLAHSGDMCAIRRWRFRVLHRGRVRHPDCLYQWRQVYAAYIVPRGPLSATNNALCRKSYRLAANVGHINARLYCTRFEVRTTGTGSGGHDCRSKDSTTRLRLSLQECGGGRSSTV